MGCEVEMNDFLLDDREVGCGVEADSAEEERVRCENELSKFVSLKAF
ncbi:hypothetical protein P6P90_14110 [Ectobacillus antri]|jgi:hypothetical protein|uniref:Uncharacterized protein n=1 Tax=Ectobacillus antri TaxID=2486280 RepID=A0ABT6H7N9_9BACI|nr:hypothetical protein [Ectobacillus antri]MDG4658030.1 hypothetical protein [Ectobacillus antri]MDG5755080.1 hypothetical protein [Ectobacillus antri]